MGGWVSQASFVVIIVFFVYCGLTNFKRYILSAPHGQRQEPQVSGSGFVFSDPECVGVEWRLLNLSSPHSTALGPSGHLTPSLGVRGGPTRLSLNRGQLNDAGRAAGGSSSRGT